MELLGGRCKGHVSTARVGPSRLTIARIKRTTLKAAAGTAVTDPRSRRPPERRERTHGQDGGFFASLISQPDTKSQGNNNYNDSSRSPISSGDKHRRPTPLTKLPISTHSDVLLQHLMAPLHGALSDKQGGEGGSGGCKVATIRGLHSYLQCKTAPGRPNFVFSREEAVY